MARGLGQQNPGGWKWPTSKKANQTNVQRVPKRVKINGTRPLDSKKLLA